MNGRIYDPVLARFMTSDPFVAGMSDLQSYNRYSYVNNNPLAYTDPSGYFKLKGLFKVAAIAAIAYFGGEFIANQLISSATSGFIAGTNGLSTALVTLGGEAGSLTALGTAVSGAASGFAGGLLASGGDVGFALKSGIAVGLTAGLGQAGMEFAGTPGSIAARSLGSGLANQAFGGNFAEGIKSGLLGAVRSEAFAYMQRETDKLATAWWGEHRMDRDEYGRVWTYGNRGCIGGGESSACRTWFPFLMPTENASATSPMFQFFGPAPASVPVLGGFLNSISKAHDWFNQVLTGVYDTRVGSPTYGGARDFGVGVNTIVDTISTVGMLPAAAFTARSIYNNPLRVTPR